MEEKKKISNSAIRLPIFIAAAIVLGIFIGANMAGNSTPAINNIYKSLAKFRQVLSAIENDYVDPVNSEELVETAINEMLTKLDPHSVYIPAKDLEMTNAQLEGNFEGIGIEFNIFRDTIYVVSPLSGGPSESLGIRPGDKIVRVDTINVGGIGITNRKVISLLRGRKGSKVDIKIKRKGSNELLDFTIERDVIPQYSVDVSYMINDETGYIKVNRFSATTYMEFKEGLNQLIEKGMKNLVIDLTGNPGGYLGQAVDMVDELISDNEMIVYTKGKDSRHNSEYRAKNKGDFENGTLIVLIDEGSASASEIVSGAIQDHDRGLVVGRRSYGKGLVQMPIALSDGSAMRLTISRYYTPSGRCIQKPYSDNTGDYHMEYYERFANGEVYNADSIKVNDSLIYKTDNGRLVYGGGGISPDYFVPLDTSKNSSYLVKLFNSNSIQEFSLRYYEQNKAELNKWDLDRFKSDFVVTNEIIEELIVIGNENKAIFDEEDFVKSKRLIATYLKAYIARSVWKNDGFYPIFNQENEILTEALNLIDEAEKLLN